MENAFTSSLLTEPPQTLEDFPGSLKMQIGPFNPQVQDSKALSIHSLHASAFRLRYGNNYPRFPAHLIQHLQPQLFPAAVDQRIHFTSGAFRPFNVPSAAQNKLFPSAFAPPFKSDAVGGHDSMPDISPGAYVSNYFGTETDDDSNFRSNSEREGDFQINDTNSKLELTKSGSTSTPSPTSSLSKEDKLEGCNGKGPEGGKLSMESTSCPICGIMVLLGEAEAHFFKELEKLNHVTTFNKDKKYSHGKYHEVGSCFPNLGNSSYEENGHGSESGIPRGRWETYQRIKSNRLSRLRIKSRKKKNGDPVCPVCNEKIQGSVENINLHVEHCLKKHSDEAEEDEEENIDVEGDSEVYGEYEWTAGLLTTASSSSEQPLSENEERISNSEREDSACLTPVQQLSDTDVVLSEEDNGKGRNVKTMKEKSVSLNQENESNFGKFQTVKANGKA